MRYCTTCGRNFEGSVDICPHDGTPLFDMGAPDEGAEVLEQAASSPPVEASTQVAEADEGLFLEPSDPVEDPEPAPQPDPDPDPDPVVAEEPEDLGLEDSLFDDEEEAQPTESIAAGIESALDEYSDPDEPAGGTLDIARPSVDDDEPQIKPLPTVKKKSNTGPIVGVLVLLLLGFAVWFFALGGQETLLGGPEAPIAKEPQPDPARVAVTEPEEDPAPPEPVEPASDPEDEPAEDPPSDPEGEEEPVEEPVTEPAPEPEPKVEPRPQPKTKPKPKAQPKPRPPEPKVQPDPEPTTEPDPEPDPEELLRKELEKLKETGR